jgi:hypothetical protein
MEVTIMCSFNLCPDTGKPYYFTITNNKLEKVYGIPNITVPVEHRPYLRQQGKVFHAYTTSRADADYSNITEMSALSFLDQYPDWMDVLIDIHYDQDSWSKQNHLGFKRALQWFAEQPIDFKVTWSV